MLSANSVDFGLFFLFHKIPSFYSPQTEEETPAAAAPEPIVREPPPPFHHYLPNGFAMTTNEMCGGRGIESIEMWRVGIELRLP